MTPLDDHWDIWVHNGENDWTINGYSLITTLHTIEDYWGFMNSIPTISGVIFIMRKGILPIWENIENKSGGAYALFFSEDNYTSYLNNITSYLISENLVTNENLTSQINGISITTKHNSYCLKIWIRNSSRIKEIVFNPKIKLQTLKFKKHFN